MIELDGLNTNSNHNITNNNNNNSSNMPIQTQESMENLLKSELRAEILKVRAQRRVSNEVYANEVNPLRERLSILKRKYEMNQKELQNDVCVHKYASVLRDNETPNYILILEAKLCRVIHHMCIKESQLRLLNEISDRQQTHMRRQISQVAQEKSQLEMDAMNSMAAIHLEEAEIREQVHRQIRTQSLELVQLQQRIGEGPDSKSDLDVLMDSLSDLNTSLLSERYAKRDDDDEPKKDTLLDEMLEPEGTKLSQSWTPSFASDSLLGQKEPQGHFSFAHLRWKANPGEVISI